MTVAPPSRIMMPSFGKALVASTTKRAVCIGVLPVGADFARSAKPIRVLLDPAGELRRGLARNVLQRRDQLRHDRPQIADQRHIDRPVHADRRRDPARHRSTCDWRCSRPSDATGRSEPARRARCRCARHRSDFTTASTAAVEKPYGKVRSSTALDERGAAGGLNHRAVHQLGERLDRLRARDSAHAVADEQDRAASPL